MTDEPERDPRSIGAITPAGVRLRPEEAHLVLAQGTIPKGRRARIPVGRGRPTKCNVALLEQLSQLIQGGIHPMDACGMAGISKKSASRWMERGREAIATNPHSRSIFAEFVRTLDGRGAIARGVLGAKLHKMGREGNIAAIQTWMKYFGVRAFQPGAVGGEQETLEAPTVTIEFDGINVFGGKELDATDDEVEQEIEVADEPTDEESPA